MHFAALRDHVSVLEVLSQHAPATLEMKDIVRLSVFVCIPPSHRWWGGRMDGHRSTMQHSAVAPLL